MKEDIFQLGVKALITNEKGNILILQVNPEKLNLEETEAYWDIPGGRIHRGNTVEQTLRRELEEETGITEIKSYRHHSTVISKIRIPLNGSDCGLILSSYICEVENQPEVEISDEHVDYKWASPEEASELLQTKYPKEFTDSILFLKN